MSALGDRLGILRELRSQPAAVADELAALRRMRERAEIIDARVGARDGAFGHGMRTAAKIILGRMPEPDAWLAPLLSGGVRER